MTDQTPDAPIQELTGHTSPETAYLVTDYPYGFRLRTEIRYWIETKRGHGQRVMSQTRNPKRAGMPWNAPKGSTYSALRALYLEPGTGHVVNDGIGGYNDEAEIRAFAARFPLTCADERNQQTVELLIARVRANSRVTWTIRRSAHADDAPLQTPEEQLTIMRKLTALELTKLRSEGGAQ